MGRKKVWNEHVKLLASLVNAISIGVLAVAVIGPLAQPDNPFYGWSGVSDEKIKGLGLDLTDPSWFDVLAWKAIAVALMVHMVAHLILRGQVDD